MGFETAFSAGLIHIFPTVAVLLAIAGFIGGMVHGIHAARKRSRAAKTARPTFKPVQTKTHEDDEL